MAGWRIEGATGSICHGSGAFFSVEGLAVETSFGPVRCWSQPIINQPEVGVLGILVRGVGEDPEMLLQAKIEPGNCNGAQLGPTVQATRSNQARIHNGAAVSYLEYFTPIPPAPVVDVLQSEQGSRFLRKLNRNIVVTVSEDVPVLSGHRWITTEQVSALLTEPDVVNMDTRTVLATLLSARPDLRRPVPSGTELTEAVDRASSMPCSSGALSWLTDRRRAHHLGVTTIPLAEMPGWERTEMAIRHRAGRHFSIVGVQVATIGREVTSWCQPMVESSAPGIAASIVRTDGGELLVLTQARVEAGNSMVAQAGPSVQGTGGTPTSAIGSVQAQLLDYLLDSRACTPVYDTVLSEEGGRFHRQRNRYLIAVAHSELPELSEDYRWCTVGELRHLALRSHGLNVEARTLLACLMSL